MRRPHERTSKRAALVAVLVLAPSVVCANDVQDYEAAAKHLGKALLLIAADRGAEEARQAAGPLILSV